MEKYLRARHFASRPLKWHSNNTINTDSVLSVTLRECVPRKLLAVLVCDRRRHIIVDRVLRNVEDSDLRVLLRQLA
jgi:hypothetical protein